MLGELALVIISLFVIVDPFGSVPVFVTYFGGAKRKVQRKAALEASLAALILLLIFAVGGNLLLQVLNISIPAFMIAGGILLLILAMDFVQGILPKSRSIEPEEAVVPIGTPLLAGPGAITTTILFATAHGLVITILAAIIVMIISFAVLYYSTKIRRVLGKNGIRIFTRIMGLLTAAIAIGFIEKALVAWGIIG